MSKRKKFTGNSRETCWIRLKWAGFDSNGSDLWCQSPSILDRNLGLPDKKHSDEGLELFDATLDVFADYRVLTRSALIMEFE